jgi:RNA polymerase sigma factor (sigma-70 family)
MTDATHVRLYRFASDEHLVDRVRAGSSTAFETVFDRHHRPLLAFCRHMLGSAADAEDAVQHTFMAAYADLMRSDKEIALRPWLYTIARHRCVSILRARRERPVAELPEHEVDQLAAEIDAREELRATLADIAHLPEDQRAALILAELGHVSHAEIAEILGCRQEKVKALVFQARSWLTSGRVARDTPCVEIREQLAAGGRAIRRTFVRQHVRNCAGCREFGEVQRRRLRVLLPVAPSLGFKKAVMGAIVGSGGGGTATGLTALVGGVAATAVVTMTVATGGGSPAAATPLAGDTPAGTLPAPAWEQLRAAQAGKPRYATAEARRVEGAPMREADPGAPPAGHRAHPVPRTSSEAAVETETAGHAPPGAQRQAGPHQSPGGGNPDGSNGNDSPGADGTGKPAGPPGGGTPDEPRGNGMPAAPRGDVKPDAPRGKPVAPGDNRPEGSSGGGKPDGGPPGPPGTGGPDIPEGGAKHDAPPGGGPAEPHGGATPAEPHGDSDPGPPAGGPGQKPDPDA